MPEAYDQEGIVNQEKRFAVAMARYRLILLIIRIYRNVQITTMISNARKYQKQKKNGYIIFNVTIIIRNQVSCNSSEIFF